MYGRFKIRKDCERASDGNPFKFSYASECEKTSATNLLAILEMFLEFCIDLYDIVTGSRYAD
jgi:hypothetical protein